MTPRFPDPLSAAERAFGFASKLRTLAYDLGVIPESRVEGAAVISIGNLRAGGSGKTPLALWLAGRIAAAGAPTAIVLRGYGGASSRTGTVVSRGRGPLVSPREAGDEAYLAALTAPAGVCVHIGADRAAAARRAVLEGARAVVLDDAFQHRRLARDRDIVLACPDDLDPSTPLLPRGPLRERADALTRAHAIAGLEDDWRGREDAPPILFAIDPRGLIDAARRAQPIPERGIRAFAFAGIARPERFLVTAARAGFEIAGSRLFPDHHRYTGRDLEEIARAGERAAADLFLTTEKDLVRIPPARNFPEIRALRIEPRIVRGAPELARVLDGLGFATSPLLA